MPLTASHDVQHEVWLSETAHTCPDTPVPHILTLPWQPTVAASPLSPDAWFVQV